ncbi:MAG: hypothetical protein GVY08_08670 [Bacteroidetes bacterium]|nr:hypothetical protein [Bacteroidota bacterium]
MEEVSFRDRQSTSADSFPLFSSFARLQGSGSALPFDVARLARAEGVEMWSTEEVCFKGRQSKSACSFYLFSSSDRLQGSGSATRFT